MNPVLTMLGQQVTTRPKDRREILHGAVGEPEDRMGDTHALAQRGL